MPSEFVILNYYYKMLKIEEVKLDVEDHQDHAWIDIKTANGNSILCGRVYRSPSNDATKEGCTQSTMAVINLIKTAYDRNIN